MKNIAIFIIGLIFAASSVSAEDAKLGQKAKLGIELNATWVSKYIWHGQDLYNDHAAFQPSIAFDYFRRSSNKAGSQELDFSFFMPFRLTAPASQPPTSEPILSSVGQARHTKRRTSVDETRLQRLDYPNCSVLAS